MENTVIKQECKRPEKGSQAQIEEIDSSFFDDKG